ncbi:hypothetical protein [Mesonia sp.]|uniref:hypothetical protein n=1 Tax=Mesonia sp. TaxID=1960830 RepID=UPI00176D9F66|nr:hypothetical protein [Mesonia sp.]HIB36553.1 hypothetical protein [Mesonia sp.]HIO27253.1 hypothetical protein [Flavobacteriaceae bacterium]
MKKAIKNLSILFSLLIMGLAITSCSSDDDSTSSDDGGSSAAELNGSITEDMMLDASVTYNLTGTFSVEEGATLTIPAGTRINTGVGTDVYMVVQKGAQIDIQGTASNPVVMKPTTEGQWGGLLLLGDATTTAGENATAEVGGLIYGGSNDADNSGSIQYLVIEQSGAQINADSQYNGLTLYAVGSGTSINHVAIINGTDDGIEFFGGTVNASNIYVENLEDDAIDWTEGWNGTLTNTYVLHTEAGFSTAIEADGFNNNPTINNFTAVSQAGGIALQFKAESGATITGLSLNGYETPVDMANDGPLSNISINGSVANLESTYTGPATVNLSQFDWVANAANDNILNGSITSDVTLDASVTYSLEGILSVENGASLTIPAGTQILTGVGTDVYIAVQKGGQIFIEGTEDAPVVMEPATEGTWGGLLLLGDATTTAGENATAEVGGLIYGGTNDTDNSGSIEYLVIKQSGAQINADSQYNGLTLYAVGSETYISNIAFIGGQDDGVEFFGGTVSASNVYVEDLEDDAIDWTEGWNGTLTNTYVLHTQAGFSTALEADGFNNNPTITNFTAVSQAGEGKALQFKAESGATITGLSLTGYNTTIDMANDGPLSNVQIEGEDADPSMSYDNDATVEVSMFDWRNN